jgi:hypothetical protein
MPDTKASASAKVNLWLSILSGLVVVLGFIWGLISSSNPIGNKADISMWIKQEIPVQLPETPNASSLALVYNNEVISRATILEIEVVNTGKKTIGENGKYSSFVIEYDNNAEVFLLSSTSIPPLDYIIEPDKSPNRLRLDVALFNPKDSITFQTVVVNPDDVSHPKIGAYISPTNRIPSLSNVYVTRQEPVQERFVVTYKVPILFITLMTFLLIGVIIRSSKKLREGLIKTINGIGWITIQPPSNPSTFDKILLILTFIVISYLIANGVSTVLTGIIREIYQHSP